MNGERKEQRPVVSPARTQAGIYPTLARVPGAQLLFVGPLACTRHGLISTLQQLHGRIAFLCLTDTEVATGRYLDKTVRAAQEVARRRQAGCLILITCCQNALLGTDYEQLTARIREETGLASGYLEVNRLALYAKGKLPLMSRPAGQLVYEFLAPREKSPRPWVNLLGPAGVEPDSEADAFLRAAGVERVRTPERCADFAAYQEMAGAHLNVALTHDAEETARELEGRLGIPWLPLNAEYDEGLLECQYTRLGEFFGYDAAGWLSQRRGRLAQRLARLQKALPSGVEVDGRNTGGALALTRWLWEQGVPVERVLLDSFSSPEDEARAWLAQQHPETALCRQTYRPAINEGCPAQARRGTGEARFPTGYERFHQVLDQLMGEREERER